jgi:hypothetical protein
MLNVVEDMQFCMCLPDPEDRGNSFLWNIDIQLQDYIVSQPRRL